MSADDRIIALLEMTERQAETIQKLLALVEQQAEQSADNQSKYNAHADKLEQKTKQALDSIESLAGKVYTQSQVTKTDVKESLLLATVHAVKEQLGGSISQDLKDQISERVSSAIDDIFNEPFKADIQKVRDELIELKNDIGTIRDSEIRAVRAFNAELLQGASDIVQETLGEFKGELQSGIKDFKSIVAQLDGLARMGTKQIKPIVEGFQNVDGVLKGHSYWFTGIFCLVWFLICMFGCVIFKYTAMPSMEVRQQAKSEMQYYETQKQSLMQQLSTINYEYKDNKVYMPVDTSDCHDNFGKRFCAKR